jgi:hypothetical protein
MADYSKGERRARGKAVQQVAQKIIPHRLFPPMGDLGKWYGRAPCSPQHKVMQSWCHRSSRIGELFLGVMANKIMKKFAVVGCNL